MTRKSRSIRSRMARSSATHISVKGLSLTEEILGHLNLGDMAFLELMGRRPNAKESIVFNAMLVTLVEHGLTPMAIVSRLTYLGAPESLQGAVAAGLCGMGTTFAGTAEGAARMLHEGLSDVKDTAPREIASQIVAAFKVAKASVPGIGHNLHKPVDPRTSRLFAIAEEQGFRGRYVSLMEEISMEAERVYGKPLPVNATGAIGALCCEMGVTWQIARGISVMGRAVGLVGHLVEEQVEPIAAEIWLRAEEEASAEPMP